MSALTDNLIAKARVLLGVPFLHQGRSAVDGVDCAGLIILACNSVGIPTIDAAGYGPYPNGGALQAYLDEQPAIAQRGSPDDRQPGDLLLLRMALEPQHLALLTAEGMMIHAWESLGCVCEHRIDAKWAARIVSAYYFGGG